MTTTNTITTNTSQPPTGYRLYKVAGRWCFVKPGLDERYRTGPFADKKEALEAAWTHARKAINTPAPALTVIDDEYQVCPGCACWLANGDSTGLDYHLTPEKAQAQLAAMHDVEAQLAADGIDIVSGDSEKDEDFSSRPCDHCGALPGSRVNFALLQRKE